MRRYQTARRKHVIAEMNVVPYIDVMLVLLIIFMVTSPLLLLTEGVDVELPEVAAKTIETQDKGPVVISVDALGKFFMTYDTQTDQPVTLDVMLARVTAMLRDQPDRRILVRGDRRVQHGEIVKLMAILQQSGVRGVGLMTQSPDDDDA
ncbi:MAG: protein TolR [Pseudomonadota bacterium]